MGLLQLQDTLQAKEEQPEAVQSEARSKVQELEVSLHTSQPSWDTPSACIAPPLLQCVTAIAFQPLHIAKRVHSADYLLWHVA